ncbi:Adenine phosphoribosyltransferase 4 [Glycine max]|nr:Adenine phosphoribosyltransferase 4 [Glycine max]
MGCPDPDETENEDPKLMGTLDEGTTIICPIYIVNISSMNPLPHLSMKGTPIIPSTDRNFNNTLFDPLSKFSTPPFHYFMSLILSSSLIRLYGCVMLMLHSLFLSGILFQDITTLLLDTKAFKETIDLFVERHRDQNINVVVGTLRSHTSILSIISCLCTNLFIAKLGIVRVWYYNLPAYYKREMEKEMKNGFKKVQATERTIFNDEEQHILFFGKFPLTTTNLQLIKKTKDNFQVNLLDMKVNLYLSLMTGASIMESGSVRAPLDEELILKE